jgi:hypothetical protein
MMSLALTDHYFDLPTLKVMGRDIKNGKALQLDEKTRENLLSALAKLKETTGIKFDKPASEPTNQSQKMQEKPFGRKMTMSLFAIGLLTALVLAGYVVAYPYRSYEECVHEEIKSGGTTASSANFCSEEEDRGNFREYGLNPLKDDFVLYNIFVRKSDDTPVNYNATELNEAVATEGTANDTYPAIDIMNKPSAAVETRRPSIETYSPSEYATELNEEVATEGIANDPM